MTELLQRQNQAPVFSTRAPRFNMGDSGITSAATTEQDNVEEEPTAPFIKADYHLKHLMPVDIKQSKYQAVPVCLFQHIGQCGGHSIVNGFCSRHVLLILNGTIQTKHALISRNGSPKLLSMTGLVNQEPLVSIDNIASQTTAIFPVFELMSKDPDPKDFTFYSNQRKPLLLEQQWLYKIYTNKLLQSEQISLNNWIEYMSGFDFPKTGWYFLGDRSLDLTKCTMVTQALCSMFQPQATDIGGITQCTFSGIGIYTNHHFVRNDSLFWEGTDPARRAIGPWLIAPVITGSKIPLRTAPLSNELQISIKYKQQRVSYY